MKHTHPSRNIMPEGKGKLTFPAFFGATLKRFPDYPALAFAGETPLTYTEVNQQILALEVLLESLGVVRGDKVAILSSNMPNWGMAYFAITFMGAVVVPLLPDFLPSEIERLLEHSQSKAIFVSDNLLPKLNGIQEQETKFFSNPEPCLNKIIKWKKMISRQSFILQVQPVIPKG
jgi:long-chain acyl-CoA synthetase